MPTKNWGGREDRPSWRTDQSLWETAGGTKRFTVARITIWRSNVALMWQNWA